MKKKVIPIAPKHASIGLKCGECLHFKANAKFEKPCSQLGIQRFSDAPNCYSPDVYLLGKKNPDTLFQLGLLLRDFSAQESRVFFAILKQSKAFEKHYELKFGQPVYFRIGNDYLSNYFHGFAIGVAECGDGQVFIGSDMNSRQRGSPMTCTLLKDSVLTVSDFKKKRAALEKEGRLVDPKPMFTMPKATLKADKDGYEPPSMDSAPAEWYSKDKPNKKVKDGRISSKSLKRLNGKLEFKVNRT